MPPNLPTEAGLLGRAFSSHGWGSSVALRRSMVDVPEYYTSPRVSLPEAERQGHTSVFISRSRNALAPQLLPFL